MDITVEGLLAKAEEAPVLFTLFVDYCCPVNQWKPEIVTP